MYVTSKYHPYLYTVWYKLTNKHTTMRVESKIGTCSSPSPDNPLQRILGIFYSGHKKFEVELRKVYNQVELSSTYPLYKSTTVYNI